MALRLETMEFRSKVINEGTIKTIVNKIFFMTRFVLVNPGIIRSRNINFINLSLLLFSDESDKRD
ncbi:unnamed protein product [Sphenostylis stenocarpa]|uniref:Uncharacterized protein n=1 Tax=Sphenostylis stenocarpa TaxID=92480 RepID=A0AA86T552_9FABA|nr:unnamed protein product [Sphenostylis stenocarpa]